MAHVTLEQAQAAKKRALQQLARVKQVVGVGITREGGEYAVKVNLSRPVEPEFGMPTQIDGVAVKVEVTGSISPRRSEDSA